MHIILLIPVYYSVYNNSDRKQLDRNSLHLFSISKVSTV